MFIIFYILYKNNKNIYLIKNIIKFKLIKAYYKLQHLLYLLYYHYHLI